MKLSFKLAIGMLLFVLCCTAGFHLLVLTGVLPLVSLFEGQLNSVTLMYNAEMLSLLGNLFLVLVVLTRAGVIPYNIPAQVLNMFLHWIALSYTLTFVDAAVAYYEGTAVMIQDAILAVFVVVLCCRIAKEPVTLVKEVG